MREWAVLFALTCAWGQATWDAKLHLHDEAVAKSVKAYCLDGTRGGFYFRPASSNADRTKWKIHFMGGGWSSTVAESAARSKTILGSSKTWTPLLSELWPPAHAAFYGLMDANSTNPFGSWNFVWLAYCDGSSQTSDVDLPVRAADGTLLHFRGRALLDAHLLELERLHAFLSTATEVLVSGTSAGGLSTFLHASFVETQLQAAGARVVALPDAGFWWDHAGYKDPHRHPWMEMVRAAIQPDVWNATLRAAGAECLRHVSDDARCYALPYLYQFLNVPTFVLQSLYDPANLEFCFKLACNLVAGTCTADETAAIQGYHAALMGNITAAQAQHGRRDGRFLTSCFQHEESCRALDWYGITIDGQTPNSTFYNWYSGGPLAGSSRIDSPYPSDTSCQQIAHGAC